MKRGLWCVLKSCSFSAVGDCKSSFVGSEWPMLECDVNGVGGECSWFNLLWLWLCDGDFVTVSSELFLNFVQPDWMYRASSFASITHHLSVTFYSDTWTTAEASCVIVCQWSLTSRIGGVGRGVAPGAQWYVLVFVLPKLWQPWSTGQDCRK